MAPTFRPGDIVFVSSCRFPSCTPSRGDVVIFDLHSGRQKTSYLKRIVAVEGDTIAIIDHLLVLNRMPLVDALARKVGEGRRPVREYTFQHRDHEGSSRPRRISTSVVVAVARDELFVLGDNSEASRDSRHFGSISRSSLSGVVLARVPTGRGCEAQSRTK